MVKLQTLFIYICLCTLGCGQSSDQSDSIGKISSEVESEKTIEVESNAINSVSNVELGEKSNARETSISWMNYRLKHPGYGSFDHFSTFYWNKTSKEQWREMTKVMTESLGCLQEYILKESAFKANIELEPGLKGNAAQFIYNCKYKRGTGIDTVRLFKQDGETEYRIIGFDVFSEHLLEAMKNGKTEKFPEGSLIVHQKKE